MILFVTILHLLLCILLVLIILLQPGKGGDVAAAFGAGGSSSNLFGPRGPTSLLSRATTVVAVLFMFTSITLAMDTQEARKGGGGELEDGVLLDEEEGFGELPSFEPKSAPAPGSGSDATDPIDKP